MIRTDKKSKNITWRTNKNGCWICTSHKRNGKSQYPRISRNNKKVYLTRFMYEHFKGKVPTGLVVRHKCDNPRCINPDHFELGTHKENMKDMVMRGRSKFGEKHYNSKLTIVKINKILEMFKINKLSQTKIAKRFKVNQSTISRIIYGKRWGNINMSQSIIKERER